MSISKKFYLKVILTYVGMILMLISIICMICSSLIFKDDNIAGGFIFVFLCFALFGLILFLLAGNVDMLFALYTNNGGTISFMYDYKNVGVPNNAFNEYKVSFSMFENGNIYMKEISKGVYSGILKDKKIILDLRGWLCQQYYIYEYFLSVIQVNLSKNNKRKLYKSQQYHIKELILYVEKENGKIYKYILVNAGMTKLTFKFKERMKMKSTLIFTDKININSLYNFK